MVSMMRSERRLFWGMQTLPAEEIQLPAQCKPAQVILAIFIGGPSEPLTFQLQVGG
jgi:hypothetical protein